jgi:hypothetical protein
MLLAPLAFLITVRPVGLVMAGQVASRWEAVGDRSDGLQLRGRRRPAGSPPVWRLLRPGVIGLWCRGPSGFVVR